MKETNNTAKNQASQKKAKSAKVSPIENINQLEQQVEQLTSSLQRERADSLNQRRRHEEQIAGMRTSIKASLVKELLPVIDNFERALKHTPSDLQENDYVKGVQGVVKQFEKTMSDMGITKIISKGHPFDPQLHEAVSAEDGDGEEIVSEELRAGYKVGDDVIRHAMVRVSRKSSNQTK